MSTGSEVDRAEPSLTDVSAPSSTSFGTVGRRDQLWEVIHVAHDWARPTSENLADLCSRRP